MPATPKPIRKIAKKTELKKKSALSAKIMSSPTKIRKMRIGNKKITQNEKTSAKHLNARYKKDNPKDYANLLK